MTILEFVLEKIGDNGISYTGLMHHLMPRLGIQWSDDVIKILLKDGSITGKSGMGNMLYRSN